MAVTIIGENDLVSVVTTEHSLLSTALSGVFALDVDLGAMQAGDTVEIRVKKKVRTGGTKRVVYKETYVDAQVEPDTIVSSVPVPGNVEVEFTLKQTAGSARTYPWKVYGL